MPLQQADFRGVAGNDGWPGRDWLRSAAASQPGTVSLRVGSGAAYDDTMKTGPVIDDALHYVKLSDPPFPVGRRRCTSGHAWKMREVPALLDIDDLDDFRRFWIQRSTFPGIHRV